MAYSWAIHMRGACKIRPSTVGNMSSLAPFAPAGGPGCTQTSQACGVTACHSIFPGAMPWYRHGQIQRFSIQDVDVQDEDGRCWATRDGEGPRHVRRTMLFKSFFFK